MGILLQDKPFISTCNILVCGGRIFESRGMLTTPNYPGDYPPSQTCEWIITVLPGRTIKVNFEGFQIQTQNDVTCPDDYLIVSYHNKKVLE